MTKIMITILLFRLHISGDDLESEHDLSSSAQLTMLLLPLSMSLVSVLG